MKAFLDDPAVKEKYLNRVRAHAQADEIIHGQYWEDGKGCAVGCTIHGSDHARYEKELGIPEWLARLEDTIFEGLPNGQAKSFPEAFLDAIPVGVNLERVKWHFCAFLMRENIERVLALTIDEKLKEQVVSAIRGVLALHEKAITSGQQAESARSAAWSAAQSAAESARSAWSAEWLAAEWSAAELARSAAESARSAAWSAAQSAARSARSARSESAAMTRYRDELLRLLREAR